MSSPICVKILNYQCIPKKFPLLCRQVFQLITLKQTIFFSQLQLANNFFYKKVPPPPLIKNNGPSLTFSRSILHNHTNHIFYSMLWQMFQKQGTPKSFSKTHFMVHNTDWIRNIWCHFPLEFKYKVDSFNLYIMDNYIKSTIGRYTPQIELPLAPKP